MVLLLNKISEIYFDKLFKSEKNSNSIENVKAKVLLVDKYTTPIISMCYTQSQLLQENIILVEFIENQSSLNTMKHLDCVAYIKPVNDSLDHFTKELKNPHFGSYQLYLNNSINKNQLEKLAEADEFEVIDNVIEIFQDYLIVNDNLFTLDSTYEKSVVEESQSLSSLLLSLKKCPIIKYESNSLELKRLASEVLYNINSNSNNNLFDDLNKKSEAPPILLLLDRKNDPLTPLITPWTYQSMIHEFLGIKKNIVELAESKERVIVNDNQDKFYNESMYLNYGDLTEKFQNYVEEYKKQTKQSSVENLKTLNLSDLKKMLTKFPEFKKLSTNILKHLNLISELDKTISQQDLWEIGELQQNLVCNLESHQFLKNKVLEILSNGQISTVNKLIILILYSVRFPNAEELTQFQNKLNDPAVTQPLPTLSQIALLKKFKSMFNSNITSSTPAQNRLGNIFNNKKININDLFNNNPHNTKTDNIYMQYEPKLSEMLNSLINPTQENQPSLTTLVPDTVSKQYGNVHNEPVQDVVIYFKGGVTYEEARLVYELSASNKKINLIIGGDAILNSSAWLNKLYDQVHETAPTSNDIPDRRAQLREIL